MLGLEVLHHAILEIWMLHVELKIGETLRCGTLGAAEVFKKTLPWIGQPQRSALVIEP
jgi:hypothetical protein